MRRRQTTVTRKGRTANGNAPRKVWKPIGKIFKLPEVLSISETEDVPVAQVFKRLRDNLVVPEKDDFRWDEDLEIRDMLYCVFAEDDGPCLDIDGLEVVSDVRFQVGVHEEIARGVVTDDTVHVDGDKGEHSADGVVSGGANEERQVAGKVSEGENFSSSSVGRRRGRGRPRKVKVVLNTRGY